MGTLFVFVFGVVVGSALMGYVALRAYEEGRNVGRQAGMWTVLDAWADKAGVTASELKAYVDRRLERTSDGG